MSLHHTPFDFRGLTITNHLEKAAKGMLLKMNESGLSFFLNFTKARIEGLVTRDANDSGQGSPSIVMCDPYST